MSSGSRPGRNRRQPPVPTPIYRIIHIDNLPTLLARSALHAPNIVPDDGLPWTSIHATETQADRRIVNVPCGLRGAIGDYVGFYFGPRSPMLLRIHTGFNVAHVEQSKIIYLVSSAQAVAAHSLRFVFTDRHSLARVASFFSDIAQLSEVDFDTCNATIWKKTPEQPDRQEKKQAEFLVHRMMPWRMIERIGVLDASVKATVEAMLPANPHRPPTVVDGSWYY